MLAIFFFSVTTFTLRPEVAARLSSSSMVTPAFADWAQIGIVHPREWWRWSSLFGGIWLLLFGRHKAQGE